MVSHFVPHGGPMARRGCPSRGHPAHPGSPRVSKGELAQVALARASGRAQWLPFRRRSVASWREPLLGAEDQSSSLHRHQRQYLHCWAAREGRLPNSLPARCSPTPPGTWARSNAQREGGARVTRPWG